MMILSREKNEKRAGIDLDLVVLISFYGTTVPACTSSTIVSTVHTIWEIPRYDTRDGQRGSAGGRRSGYVWV